MMVSIESTGALERRMSLQVPAQQVAEAISARLQSLSRKVRINGFRPGKVPVTVVKQQYGAAVRQEVVEDLVQKAFSDAATEQKLNPAGQARIEQLKDEEGQDLSFHAIFEVYPEIKVQGITSLTVNQPKVEVAESDIDAMIDNLRRQQATYSKVERAAKESDRVTIDFEGKIDGVAFEGGKGSNFPVVLGAGRMLPDFETGIFGMTAGQTKQVPVQFPADYAATNLAGKVAEFTITAHTVEEAQLPEANDEFATAFGVTEGGIAKLRQEVADNMRRELTEKVRSRVRQQLFDGLLAANMIDVPNALVSGQVLEMQQDAAREMGIKDVTKLPPSDVFQEPARKRVALSLILAEVLTVSGVALDRARVQTKLQDMAQGYSDPARLLKVYSENREALKQIENLVLEDQLIEWLLSQCKITAQPLSFKELMNLDA